MPTHQGKTHTDILIGDGGENVQESSEFEYFGTYSTLGSLQYRDFAPNTDRCYAGYEVIVRDSNGGLLASFAARYKAWVDRGSATGPKTIDIVNNFTPAPIGGKPSWPLSPITSAERDWRVDTFDPTGNLYAQAYATWQLRSTVASGATVIQTVMDQTDSLLRVHLVYLKDRTIYLDLIATMTATATVVGSVTADPPDVTDRFTP